MTGTAVTTAGIARHITTLQGVTFSLIPRSDAKYGTGGTASHGEARSFADLGRYPTLDEGTRCMGTWRKLAARDRDTRVVVRMWCIVIGATTFHYGCLGGFFFWAYDLQSGVWCFLAEGKRNHCHIAVVECFSSLRNVADRSIPEFRIVAMVPPLANNSEGCGCEP